MPTVDLKTAVCTIRIELVRSDPPIWREVEAPVTMTLFDLHLLIQAVMAWDGSHMWEFRIDKKAYTVGDFDGGSDFASGAYFDAENVELIEVMRPRRTTFQYMYDFGDSWLHQAIVGKARPPEAGVEYPRYVGGERNAPPEDIGGLYGFYDFLDAGGRWADQDSRTKAFDPDFIDVPRIAKALRALGKHLRRT